MLTLIAVALLVLLMASSASAMESLVEAADSDQAAAGVRPRGALVRVDRSPDA